MLASLSFPWTVPQGQEPCGIWKARTWSLLLKRVMETEQVSHSDHTSAAGAVVLYWGVAHLSSVSWVGSLDLHGE